MNEREKNRTYMNALAANEGSNPALIKALHQSDGDDEEEKVEWLTPNSDEELRDILGEFNELPFS